MRILKGIMHHWNKTKNDYDTIHPETEVAQITDWNNGIVNTLASTALDTLGSILTSDSLLATMIQKVLTATGTKYNMAQNGYICFGSFFGNLVIQWVFLNMSKKESYKVVPPLDFTCLGGCVSDHGMARYSFGFSPDKLICYSHGDVNETLCHIIMIGVV